MHRRLEVGVLGGDRAGHPARGEGPAGCRQLALWGESRKASQGSCTRCGVQCLHPQGSSPWVPAGGGSWWSLDLARNGDGTQPPERVPREALRLAVTSVGQTRAQAESAPGLPCPRPRPGAQSRCRWKGQVWVLDVHPPASSTAVLAPPGWAATKGALSRRPCDQKPRPDLGVRTCHPAGAGRPLDKAQL